MPSVKDPIVEDFEKELGHPDGILPEER